MNRSRQIRRWVAASALMWLALGVAPRDSQANEERLTRMRAAAWQQMLPELEGRGIHVYEPDRSNPQQRAQFESRPPTSIAGVRGRGPQKERFTVPTWEIRALGKIQFDQPRTIKMKRVGQTAWGRPGILKLAITNRGKREPELRVQEAGRDRQFSYRVDFQPKASWTIKPRSGGNLPDEVSRLVKGTRFEGTRAGSRTYSGLEGTYRITEHRGTLLGRPVARLARGGFVYAGVREGTQIQRAILEAKFQVGDLWISLTLDASFPINGDPATEWKEDELFALMDAFAAACSAVPAAPPPEARAVRIFDANPIYTGGMPVEDIVGHDEVPRYVTQEREAVAADGVTQVLLEVEFDEPGVLELAMPEENTRSYEDGSVKVLFGGRALAVGEGDKKKIAAYALYTAPRAFAEPTQRMRGGAHRPTDRYRRRIATREIALHATFGPSRDEQVDLPEPIRIPLVRPPVLLVHGTFDNPDQCWEQSAREQEPTLGTVSMAAALRQAGYLVFKTDFSQTNGNVGPGSGRSSFRHNARVLWENPGGIYDALRAYRAALDIAATQVDVVGHSLGGLIPRLWASDEYNPRGQHGATPFDREQTVGYRRVGNFGQGDIHRLITIATPHMGSDLGHLGLALEETPEKLRTRVGRFLLGAVPPGAADPKTVENFAFWALGVWKGYGITPVVRDQRPHLEAAPNQVLVDIGPTEVPSHSIVCAATLGDMHTFDAEYKAPLQVVAWWMLNARPTVVKEFFLQRGQAEDLDRIFGELREVDRRNRDPSEPPGRWVIDAKRGIKPADSFTLYALGRAMLFGNSQNDMVVRVESQRGGLPFQYRTFIRGVLHSFATRYARVQHAVVEALCGPYWRFSDEGFPTPIPMGSNERHEFEQDPATRTEAVTRSNIVPAHAEALSYVADEEEVILIMRPVNRYATPLIAMNIATKDMHVKGKSSNWGPQRGFIPVEQRFSKLHFDTKDRAAQIRKFDGKVQDCLRENRARETALQITVAGARYAVLVVEDDKLEPPAALVLQALDGEAYRGWESGGEMQFDPSKALPEPRLSPAEIERHGTHPLMVLADRNTGVALTADYDILAFGRKLATGETQWDPEMGAVTPWQRALIGTMNTQVRQRSNYIGGNVSHHGPEVQFEMSPGADYPNAVFEADGDIRIIEEGPPGRKDLYLKRYFHVMRTLGWHLDPNPHTWNWGPYDPERWPHSGWRPDDHLQLPATPSGVDNPFDSDEGDEPVAPARAKGAR